MQIQHQEYFQNESRFVHRNGFDIQVKCSCCQEKAIREFLKQQKLKERRLDILRDIAKSGIDMTFHATDRTIERLSPEGERLSKSQVKKILEKALSKKLVTIRLQEREDEDEVSITLLTTHENQGEIVTVHIVVAYNKVTKKATALSVKTPEERPQKWSTDYRYRVCWCDSIKGGSIQCF